MSKQLIGAFLIIPILFFKSVGGRVEGYLFPVTTLGVITKYEPMGETWTRVWGHSERLRQCSFEHLSWYLAHNGHNARADVMFEEGTKVRDGGEFDFGPWVVQLTPSQLFTRSYSIVYHRCHPFWLTETRFFE